MAREKQYREKQYAVEILESHQHGQYGKRFYFGMYVPGFSKKDAEEVAMEELAAMTWSEINSRCVTEKALPWSIWYQPEYERINGKDAAIGYKLARMFFSCKAYIEK